MIKRNSELPLPYMPIDPMICESDRMSAFVEAADLFNNKMAEAHIIFLLLYVGRHPTENGSIGKISPKRISYICRWDGDPEVFLDALIKSGWLEKDGSGVLRLEGFERHGGQVLKERIRWRESKRKTRKPDGDVPGMSRGCPGDVPGMSRGCPGDITGTPAGVPPLKGEGEPDLNQKRDYARAYTRGKNQSIENEPTIAEHLPANEPRDPTPVAGKSYGMAQVEGYLYDWGMIIRGERDRAQLRPLLPLDGQELNDSLLVTEQSADKPNIGFLLSVLRSQRKKASVSAAENPIPPPPPTNGKDEGEIPMTDEDLYHLLDAKQDGFPIELNHSPMQLKQLEVYEKQREMEQKRVREDYHKTQRERQNR